ncbi:MAG: methionine--tRNA ligase [Candidatus Eremiobacteraeota bacterium]|nr:methionine--tRNA ligase [Candidatus Eremiobacteraeota bacterium]
MSKNTKSYFVTTPIYYPDEIPHLSAGYATIMADCCARYRRMVEDSVHLITGSDEHGQKVQEAAKSHRKTPQEFVDRMVRDFITAWKKLQISYDDFVRTTDDRHIQIVENIFEKLLEKGDIYTGEFSGWYCIECETFWPESMVERKRCPRPECRHSVKRVKEQGYFFRLSKYRNQILDYLEKTPGFIKPEECMKNTIDTLRGELEDICITRKGPIWGIPVPSDPDFKIYVWLDALLNYIAAVGYGSDEFEKYWPADIHIIGRDMVNFHTIIWPAICFALEIPLPGTIFSQGWVISGGKKISRSLHGSTNLVEIVDEFGSDALRYYFLREVSPGDDLEFSIPRLTSRFNNQLANDLGNLFRRSISMTIKYCDGMVPERGKLGSRERNLARVFKEVKKEYKKLMDKLEFREALISLWDLVGELNRYIDNKAPWDLYKKEDKEELNTTLYTLMDYLRIITVLVMPFVPRTAIKMWRRLGFRDILRKKKFDSVNIGLFPAGQTVKMQSPLFPRIETMENG